MKAEALFYSALDLVFETAPAVVSKATKRIAKRHLRADVASTPTTQRFFILRVMKRWKGGGPLSSRSVHVPNEDGRVTLDETTEPILGARYVIQEHRATRAGRHFDVRIEYKGRAISWAVPMKGKRAGLMRMPVPGEKWMAIRQPDHTVEYMGFSGEIPEGSHGAGQVSIFAEGICDVFKIEDGHVHVRFLSGAAQGDYVLVDTGKQGLIVPKTIKEADGWTKHRYTKKALDDVTRRCEEGQWVAETKVDGGSIELVLGDYGARALSHRISRRDHARIEHSDRLPHLRDHRAAGLEGTRLRGEIWHSRGVSFVSGTLNSGVSLARQRQTEAGPLCVQIFDITHFKGRDVRHLPYGERQALYREACDRWDSPYARPVRATREGLPEFYAQEVARRDIPTDGIVVKRLGDAHGQRPWIKVKPHDLSDCRVLEARVGTGKHASRLGSLLVETPSGGAVSVGSGFSDKARDWLWLHRNDLAGQTARVAFHVRHGERTDTGPRFIDFHPDKSDERVLRMYAEEQ